MKQSSTYVLELITRNVSNNGKDSSERNISYRNPCENNRTLNSYQYRVQQVRHIGLI